RRASSTPLHDALPISKLERADCTGASFVDATLEGVAAARVMMNECDLTRMRAAERSDFSDGSFHHAKANNSFWTDARLDRADLSDRKSTRLNSSHVAI